MSEPAPTLQAAREQAIDALCRGFANDALSMAELERRLSRAREARTRDELRSLLADLRRPAAPPARTTGTAPARAEERSVEPSRKEEPARTAEQTAPSSGEEIRRGSHLAFAIMAGTRRAGRWAPPGNMLAVAVMGGVELDFRDAILSPGVTEINVFAFWGGVEITVPPDVHVDTHGLAIMGGFEQTAETDSDPPPGAPTIRINGVAIMAGVEVTVQPRGVDVTRGTAAGEIEGSGRSGTE